MKLEDLEVYNLSMELGEKVWDVTIKFDHFIKETLGKQLLRSCDSIAANLSERFGRYSYNETRQFSYFSRGSLYETKTWLKKACNRKLISSELYNEFQKDITNLGVKINNYINAINRNKKQLK